MTEKKGVPAEERERVAALVRRLLDERGPDGRRLWSQARLGKALGGLSQETIRRAQTEDGVVPAVRDALMHFSDGSLPSGKPPKLFTRADFDDGTMPDRFEYGRKVASAIADELAISLAEARAVVGQIAFDEGQEWSTELDLYRLAIRAARSQAHGGALGVGERQLRRKKS